MFKISETLVFFTAALIVILLWLCYPTIISLQMNYFGKGIVDDANAYGDLYGSLNTLFSGLAFFLILLSNYVQFKEIRSAKEDIAQQHSRLDSQLELIHIQNFENSFFNMLDFHNQYTARLESGPDHMNFHFSERNFLLELEDAYSRHGRINMTRQSHFDILCEAYMHALDSGRSDLKRHFGYLYQIIKYIDGADFPKPEKKRYCNILRSQLSNEQLFLIFLNGLCYPSKKKVMKKYIEEYSLLELLPKIKITKMINAANRDITHSESLITEEYYKDFYEKNAFGTKQL
ncbi:putative phage abortive infection protein [Aeromonas veronii]